MVALESGFGVEGEETLRVCTQRQGNQEGNTEKRLGLGMSRGQTIDYPGNAQNEPRIGIENAEHLPDVLLDETADPDGQSRDVAKQVYLRKHSGESRKRGRQRVDQGR